MRRQGGLSAGAEVVDNVDEVYETDKNPFWLVSCKSWKNENVYYHETLLYELLGNSEYANIVFVEVPRLAFLPHKILDATSLKV